MTWILIFAVTRNIIMIQKPETRTDRLDRLCRLAKRPALIAMEDRACLECEACLGNLLKNDNKDDLHNSSTHIDVTIDPYGKP